METTRTTRNRRATAPLAFAAAVALTALAGCSADAGSPGQGEGDIGEIEPIVITYADYLPDSSTFGRMSQFFQENVTERTGGAVTFENYWAGSLLGQPEQLAGVRDGIADIGLIFGGIFPSELPIASWLLALGLDQTGSPLHDFAAGTAAMQELASTWEPLREEFADNGLMPLYWTSTVPFMALCTDPITSGDDAFEGRNTRASGVFQSGATEALGAIPVTVAFNEIYEGLQRGVLDCALMDPGSIPAFDFADVAQEFVPLSIISALGGYTVNLDFWESLPSELQNIIYEEAAHASFEFTHIANDDVGLLGALLDEGRVRVNDVSDLAPLIKDYQESTLADLPSVAPPGVDDPQAVIDRFVERKAYWTDVLVELGYPLVGSDPESLSEFFLTAGDIDLTPFWERYREEVVLPGLPG